MMNFIALLIGILIAPFVFLLHVVMNLVTMIFGGIFGIIFSFLDSDKK